jgi:hypothetical protein
VYVNLAATNATTGRPENQTATLHQNQTVGANANQPRTANATESNPRQHVRILGA